MGERHGALLIVIVIGWGMVPVLGTQESLDWPDGESGGTWSSIANASDPPAGIGCAAAQLSR